MSGIKILSGNPLPYNRESGTETNAYATFKLSDSVPLLAKLLERPEIYSLTLPNGSQTPTQVKNPKLRTPRYPELPLTLLYTNLNNS